VLLVFNSIQFNSIVYLFTCQLNSPKASYTGLQKKCYKDWSRWTKQYFYAKFKYVLSFSLSRKVFKWHTVIIWRKRIFMYYINVLLHYLKGNCAWFSALCRLWNVSLEGPAVVCQHTEAPLALVPLFHVGNVLMKSLSPCSSQTAPRFSRKKYNWESKKCTFRDILHPIAL
jgi:hypothetical protein